MLCLDLGALVHVCDDTGGLHQYFFCDSSTMGGLGDEVVPHLDGVVHQDGKELAQRQS